MSNNSNQADAESVLPKHDPMSRDECLAESGARSSKLSVVKQEDHHEGEGGAIAEDEIPTPQADAILEYLAVQFPATVGHIPLREKLREIERELAKAHNTTRKANSNMEEMERSLWLKIDVIEAERDKARGALTTIANRGLRGTRSIEDEMYDVVTFARNVLK